MKYLKLFAFILLSYQSSLLPASWKVFMYMDASGNLSDMAFKNIADIIKAHPSDEVDICVQLHAYDDKALRFVIQKNTCIFDKEALLTGDAQHDFITAAHWAFSDVSDFDHTMILFWNHGWGVLDPHWNAKTNEWQIDESTCDSECSIKRQFHKNLHSHHKGFIFNYTTHTYLTTQVLGDSLSYVQSTILHGKKLDIIAFDTCMGAMIEVAYQCAPYAHYLVGNQTCALRDGFNYSQIIELLNHGLVSREVAHGMVRAFNEYYCLHDESGIYAHSALDLSKISLFAHALKKVVKNVTQNSGSLLLYEPVMKIARALTQRVCMFSMYTDMISFFKYSDEQLENIPQSDELEIMRKNLQNLYSAAQQCVVANCAGETTRDSMNGFSTYLPFSAIDSSYHANAFACDTGWIDVLQLMC